MLVASGPVRMTVEAPQSPLDPGALGETCCGPRRGAAALARGVREDVASPVSFRSAPIIVRRAATHARSRRSAPGVGTARFLQLRNLPSYAIFIYVFQMFVRFAAHRSNRVVRVARRKNTYLLYRASRVHRHTEHGRSPCAGPTRVAPKGRNRNLASARSCRSAAGPSHNPAAREERHSVARKTS